MRSHGLKFLTHYVRQTISVVVVGSRPSSIVDARPVCDEDDDVVSQCGGHGTCDRGQCRCNPYYAGPTCDECFACDDSRFRNVWSCVECEVSCDVIAPSVCVKKYWYATLYDIRE